MPAYDRQVPDGSLANDPSLLLSNPATGPAGPVLANVGGTNLVQNVIGAVNPDDTGAKTIQAIFKLGGAALQPYVDQAAQEQFMTGVRRSMQGEALQEIATDQPWYTQLFGQGQEIAGARAYSVQSRLATATAELESSLPSWADKPGSFVQEQVQKTIQGALTGDAQADSLIQAEGIKLMAPLFKQHAKLAYKAQAAKANEDWQVNLATNSKLFNERAGNPDASVEDFSNARTGLMQLLEPPPGMAPETYERGIANLFLNASAAGQFRTVNELESVGVLDALSGTYKDNIIGALRTNATRAVGQASPDFAIQKVNVENATGITAGEKVKMMQLLNEQFAAETGIPVKYAQLIPSANFDNILGRDVAGLAAAKNKQLVEEAKLSNASNWLTAGALSSRLARGDTDKQTAEKVIAERLGEQPTPALIGQVANLAGDNQFEAIRKYINPVNLPDQYTQGFGDAYDRFKAIDPGIAAKYLEKADVALYNRFEQNLAVYGKDQRVAAYLAAKVAPKLYGDGPVEPKSSLGKAMAVQAEKMNENIVWRNNITDASLSNLTAYANQTAKQLRQPGMSDELLAKQVLGYAVGANGGAIVGSHFIAPGPGATRTMEQLFSGVSKEEYTEAFEQLFDEAAAHSMGLKDVAGYQIIRAADFGSEARFMILANDSEGKAGAFPLTSEAIRTRAQTFQARAISSRVRGAPETRDTTGAMDLSAQGAMIANIGRDDAPIEPKYGAAAAVKAAGRAAAYAAEIGLNIARPIGAVAGAFGDAAGDVARASINNIIGGASGKAAYVRPKGEKPSVYAPASEWQAYNDEVKQQK